jgi:hypothetical protein
MKKTLVLLGMLFCFSMEARLYFVHVPKTAGTTLRYLLETQVGGKEIYPYRNQRQARSPITHDLVSGHLPYWLCNKLDPEFDKAFKITVLREPLSRYRSFLHAKMRGNSEHPDLESILDPQYKKKYWLGLLDNAMCRFLAASPNLEGEDLLKSAIEGLEKFDAVVFFETFQSDVVDLFHRLGITLNPNDIPKMNEAEAVFPATDELLEKLKNLNLWDLKLYEYAKTHLKKKETTYPLRGPSFEELLNPKSSIDYTFDLPLNGNGWSYRDQKKEKNGGHVYRWIMDKKANIYFPLEERRDYEFSFEARALREGVQIRVWVGDHEVELYETKEFGDYSLYRGIIRKEWIEGPLVQISFQPQSHFSYSDQRERHLRVSFAVHRIQLTSW